MVHSGDGERLHESANMLAIEPIQMTAAVHLPRLLRGAFGTQPSRPIRVFASGASIAMRILPRLNPESPRTGSKHGQTGKAVSTSSGTTLTPWFRV